MLRRRGRSSLQKRADRKSLTVPSGPLNGTTLRHLQVCGDLPGLAENAGWLTKFATAIRRSLAETGDSLLRVLEQAMASGVAHRSCRLLDVDALAAERVYVQFFLQT